MAETLTYENPTDQTQLDNLSEDEQDSLAVGTKMVEEQEQLLAGKYKNAEELEKAYVELQKKLGDDAGEAEETVDETNEESEPATPEVQLLTDAASEYEEKGELSTETLAKFADVSSKDLVDSYMKMYGQALELQAKEGSAEAPDLSDNEINTIQNSVGGKDQYEQLLGWAVDNLSSNTVEAFDSLVDTGNAQAIQLALDGIKAQYDNANGYEGRMLQGKAPNTSGDVFRSQQELVAAMSDPRYDNDPAYRSDIIDKLDRSNIDF